MYGSLNEWCFLTTYLVERVNAYMKGKSMFALFCKYYYLPLNAKFFDKNLLHKQQSVDRHFHKIVKIFIKSTLKFSIFVYKIAKSCSFKCLRRLKALPHTPGFFVLQSYSLIRKTLFHRCIILIVFARLYYQLCFLLLKFS